MKKHINSIIVISLLFTLFFVCMSITAFAYETDCYDESNEYTIVCDCPYSENCTTVSTIFADKHILPNEQICFYLVVDSELDISSFIYEQSGYSNISLSRDAVDDKKINVILEALDNFEESQLVVDITMENGENLRTNVFSFNNEYGSFLSDISFDDAVELYFNYAIENNILTIEECAEIRNEHYLDGVIFGDPVLAEETMLVEERIQGFGEQTSVQSNNSENILTVRKRFLWQNDYGVTLPLRYVRVLIGPAEISAQPLILHTDVNGYITAEFDISSFFSSFTLVTIVYAGDENVHVMNTSYSQVYSVQLNETINCANPTYTPSYVFDMRNDFGKSLQISQAALFARNYAAEMMGRVPEATRILYPVTGNRCYYVRKNINNTYTGQIYINNQVSENETIASYAA